MSETKLYHVEKETQVTIRNFKPDVLTEQDAWAWVLVDTIETDTTSWRVMQEWFDTGERTTGRYRLVEMTPYGGNFHEYEVRQTLELQEVKRPAELEVVS